MTPANGDSSVQPAWGEPGPQATGLRVGFLAIGRKRPGFDPDWGRQIETEARRAFDRMGLDVIQPREPVFDDTSLRRALDEMRQAGCDTLIVLQPTMGDGRLAPVLAQLWSDPIVFWATPERQDSVKVSSCSLVGTHVFASMFRQLGRPFELVFGHPDNESTQRELTVTLRLASAGAKLRRAKVGLVGGHAPGFVNMHADPFAVHRELGVELHHIGLEEFFGLVEGQEVGAVDEDLNRVEAIGLPMEEGLKRQDLAVNSHYYLAMRALLAEENLDALAVRCWPELPKRFGNWPYLAMSRMADENRVVALEGDFDGAISCLVGRLLGIGVGYVSDWLEHDEHSITLWHPGHAPLSMCTPGSARLGRHFNNDMPLVVNATLAADRAITLTRLWRCDGSYRMTAWEARTALPRRELLGAAGLAIVDGQSVPELFDALCHQGMPHHVTVFPGRHAGLLRRLARQLQLAWMA